MDAVDLPVKVFLRQLYWVLTFRAIARWGAFWFCFSGIIAIAGRIVWGSTYLMFLLGVLGLIPLVIAAAILSWRKLPKRNEVKVLLDKHNNCGGMLMLDEFAEGQDESWIARLPSLSAPQLCWKSKKTLSLLTASSIFFALTLLIPNRFVTLNAKQSLQIGELVEEIRDEIVVLEEERILEVDKSAEMKESLEAIEKDSLGQDPGKTWEALDHLSETTGELAQEAAEEAVSQLAALSGVEAMTQAMLAMETGLIDQPLNELAMKELNLFIREKELEESLIEKTELSKEFMDALKDGGLSSEQLNKLLDAIEMSKEQLAEMAKRLAEMKLIDAEALSKCESGACKIDKDALIAFLNEEMGKMGKDGKECLALCVGAFCQQPGKGAIQRGPGHAPISWTEGSSEENNKFKEETIPLTSLAGLSDSSMVGVSRAEPSLADEATSVERGKLDDAQKGGGAAHLQSVLPRHKGVVERFFKRE